MAPAATNAGSTPRNHRPLRDFTLTLLTGRRLRSHGRVDLAESAAEAVAAEREGR